MKNKMILLAGILPLAFVWVSVAADVTLDGVKTYDVATGMTTNENDRLTGSGSIRKTGQGTLALMNGGNDFTGGIDVQIGILEARAPGALGKGKVTLANNTSQLFFKANPSVPGAFVEFTNDVEVTGTSSAVDSNQSIYFYTNTAIRGNVTAARSVLMRHDPAPGNPGKGGASATVYGSITAPNLVTFNAYGTFAIHGPITTPLCYGGTSHSGTGTVELWDPASEIDKYVISHDILSFQAANAMRGLVEWRPAYTAPLAGYSNVKLNGFPQTIKGIHFCKVDNWAPGLGWYLARYKAGVNSFAFMSTAPVTLTLTGMAGTTCESYAKLNDEVSLDVNAAGLSGFVQQFRYYASPTKGSVAVNAGTLQVLEAATFPNVPSVMVGVAGALALENTTNTFAGATNLVLNGTLTIGEGVAAPFPMTLTDLTLGASASVTSPVGKPAVVYTRRLTVGGETKELGEYVFGGLTVVVTEGIHLGGACTLDVPAGTTNVLTCLVWGDGSIRKTGLGALSFTRADNTFTGGLTVASGTIIVAATNALGTGPVTLLPTGTQECQVRFVANAAIPNEILHDGTSTETYPALYFEKTVTSVLKGPVTSTGDLFAWNDQKVAGGTFPAPGPVTTFECPVDAPNHRIALRTYGDMHFKGAVTAKRLGTQDTGRWSEGGRLYLYSSSNDVGEVYDHSPYVCCMAANVLGGRLILASGDWTSGGTRLEMSGFGQSVSSLVTLNTTVFAKVNSYNDLQKIDGLAGTTLTLTGEVATNQTYARLSGGVSLLVDAKNFKNSFVQKFYGRTHTTTGDLIVSNGTLEVTGPAVFTKVGRIVVGAGGVLKLNSETADALAAVTNLVVAGTLKVGDQKAFGSELTSVTVTGSLKVNADGLPLAKGTALMVGGDWLLDIPENTTLRVHALRDMETGREYGGGEYGGTDSGAACQDLASHFSGKGKLVAPSRGTLVIFR